jgi:hypothetical protein
MNLTSTQRLCNLLVFFGWQGGTIHQISKETGIDAYTLLYSQPSPTQRNSIDFSNGSFGLRTCGLDFRIKNLAPKANNNETFWLGVALAVPPQEAIELHDRLKS